MFCPALWNLKMTLNHKILLAKSFSLTINYQKAFLSIIFNSNLIVSVFLTVVLFSFFIRIDDSLLCLDKTQRNMVFAHLEYQLSLPKYYFLRKAKQLRIKEEKLKSKRAFSKLHKAITETMPAVIASYDAELRRFAELQ